MSSTGSFEHLGDQLLVEGHVVSMFRSEFRAPNGEAFSREVVRHPGAVSVVPLLDDGDVVLVRQYRAPLDQFLLEIPAGKRDVAGEPPEETARRELAEEVGLVAAELVPLTVLTGGVADHVLTPNAVRVHVMRLRKRIAPMGLAIQTVHGRGYLLETSP